MPIPPHPADRNDPDPGAMSKRNRALLVLAAVGVLVVVALHLAGVIGPG